MKEQRKKILIVDDEEILRRLMQRSFLSAGYEIVMAENGTEAIEKAEKEEPDLILLDVMMPEMNGFAVCRKLRENPKFASTPILMVTALRSEADKEAVAASGATDHLVKPVNQEELVARVRKYLHSPFK
ncbi:MAG: response regulator [Bacteroidota bacterium]